eukprot:gene666-biopygen2147
MHKEETKRNHNCTQPMPAERVKDDTALPAKSRRQPSTGVARSWRVHDVSASSASQGRALGDDGRERTQIVGADAVDGRTLWVC